MTAKTPFLELRMNDEQYRAAWKALDLLEDWLTTGYSRAHPELVIDRTGNREPAPAGAPASGAGLDRAGLLAALAEEVASCARCGLSANRNKTVPGEGSLDPEVLFIGEGPGVEEDRTGRPWRVGD